MKSKEKTAAKKTPTKQTPANENNGEQTAHARPGKETRGMRNGEQTNANDTTIGEQLSIYLYIYNMFHSFRGRYIKGMHVI